MSCGFAAATWGRNWDWLRWQKLSTGSLPGSGSFQSRISNLVGHLLGTEQELSILILEPEWSDMGGAIFILRTELGNQRFCQESFDFIVVRERL